MNAPLSRYARLGLVHHMLYPDCGEHPQAHVETLKALAHRTDIETFDCCVPFDAAAEAELAPALRACGKEEVTFATHFFPARKLWFSSPLRTEQAQIRMLIRELVRQAAAIGAIGFIFPSGGPPPDQATPEEFAAFAGFCRWLCGVLGEHGMTALLEPFDTTIDKCFLYGSTTSCVELIESLRPEIDNLRIELDVAHLPLMGERFGDAIRTVAPVLERVHLGNCVLQDRDDPRYGDTHPPVGYPGGEIDVPELAEILACLREVGFLHPDRRGCLLLEMTPWPGRSVEETIRDAWARLEDAWKRS